MRAFSLVTLSPEAFDDFSAHHADGNFQQTSAAGRLRAGQGIEVEYLGVQENGTIVAGALFETHRSPFPPSVWCTTAPCVTIAIAN